MTTASPVRGDADQATLPSTIVVIDTDAFSMIYVRRARSAEAQTELNALKRRLQGRIVVIGTQTRAELMAWPLLRDWGPSERARLDEIVRRTTTVPVSDDVVNAFVGLTVECQRGGHALAQKDHVADRWVAATAVALDRPLLALDRIYERTPGLTLVP